MKFKDLATEEQLWIREQAWGSLQGLLGRPKTAQLIDLILKTCREALKGYFIAYHDSPNEADLLLLIGKRTESGLYTVDTFVINDMFQKENKNAQTSNPD